MRGALSAQPAQRVAHRHEPAARAPRARGGPAAGCRLRSPLGLILAGGSTGDNDLPVAPSGGLGTLLAVLTTNQKGLVAETAVIHECAMLGVPVAKPLDDQHYDLIFDLGAKLLRVQCKWAAKRVGDVVAIRTRTLPACA